MQPDFPTTITEGRPEHAKAAPEQPPCLTVETTVQTPDHAHEATEAKPAADQSISEASPARDQTSPAPVTDKARALARLIAEGRQPRSLRFTELEPYRDVLLTERRGGASIRLMAQSLAKLGVDISVETLRVWLLRQKMPKRRKPRASEMSSCARRAPRPTTPRFRLRATGSLVRPAASCVLAAP